MVKAVNLGAFVSSKLVLAVYETQSKREREVRNREKEKGRREREVRREEKTGSKERGSFS